MSVYSSNVALSLFVGRTVEKVFEYLDLVVEGGGVGFVSILHDMMSAILVCL